MLILGWILKNQKLTTGIVAALAIAVVLTITYRKGKAACEAEVMQEKVYIYEKANDVKNDIARLPDGDAMRVLRSKWQR